MRAAWSISVVALVSIESRDAMAESARYEQLLGHVGATGTRSAVSGRSGGGFAMEIKAMVTDHLAIGGRVDLGMMFGGAIGRDEDLPLDFAMAACGLVKAELFLSELHDGVVRPWVGLGAGGYTIGGQTIASGPDHAGISQTTGRYFGVAPQLGIDVGPVRLAATYNAILGASLEVRQTAGTVEQTYEYSQNYVSLELSFRFAGGRKRTPPSI